MKLSPQAEEAYRLQAYGSAAPIDGVAAIPLRRFNDDGGAMIELTRLHEAAPEGLEGFVAAQINYSTIQPGVIKAFHVHRRQTDVWFVPPEDRVLLVLVDTRAGSASEGALRRIVLGDGQSQLIRIPPGVAHGCRNLGQTAARVIYFTDVVFSADAADCDEGRLPWDFKGADVWDLLRE